MIDVEKSITDKIPQLEATPTVLKKLFFEIAKRVVCEKEINSFVKTHKLDGPFAFIEAVLEHFSFSYKISHDELENIPSSGRVVIIANHPLGALDALSLIDLVKKVRKDVKIVANEILSSVTPLDPILIKVDVFSGKISKESIKQINDSLSAEEAVIFFPSGEVSRVRPTGVKDVKWHKGFLRFALKNSAPILPVFIKAKNSMLFYTVSSINKAFSAILLPKEMFKKKGGSLEFKIGEIIPFKSFSNAKIDTKTQVKLFKKHLYRVAKDKKSVFETQKCIAHPEERQLLRDELKNCELLGKTKDGKAIYLYKYEKESFLLREIGRLREHTFRKVEEGTGKKRDTDKFDRHYEHIVLWDDELLEVVGSYRIARGEYVLENFGFEGFYSNSLFKFQPEFEKYINRSIELGRSFVQPRYWGSRALDYLWQGIGAYLHKNPDIRYMFGPVSISSSMPKGAQDLIIFYYDLYYGDKKEHISAFNPFQISKQGKEELREIFDASNAQEDYKILKEQLGYYGASVPILYKHYTELCEEGGVSFMGFNIDEEFNNCVDSFIFVDIHKIKPRKKERYIR